VDAGEAAYEEHCNLYISPNITWSVLVKEGEMGRACSMYGRDEKCIQYFDQKTCKEETTWKT